MASTYPDPNEVLEMLEEERQRRCGYIGDTSQRCDCKFFNPEHPNNSEHTGCAELRWAMRCIDGLAHEVMGYQVSNGYQQGYEHGQAAVARHLVALADKLQVP